MFRNLTLFHIQEGLPEHYVLSAQLDAQLFVECGATQDCSAGWVSPRRIDHASILESINGHWFACLRIQTRTVPKSEIQARLKEQVEKIQAATGRKPGKNEKRDLSDEIKRSLLPQAFVKTVDVKIWIDPKNGYLGVDAVSATKADRVIDELLRCCPSLRLQRLQTNTSPQTAMRGWLLEQRWPTDFVADRSLELQSSDESRGSVRFARLSIETQEVRAMLEQGKLPTRMALTWSDKVGFVLSDSLVLRSINLISTPDEQKGEGHAEAFDADATIFSGTVGAMLGALIEALGDEHVLQEKLAA